MKWAGSLPILGNAHSLVLAHDMTRPISKLRLDESRKAIVRLGVVVIHVDDRIGMAHEMPRSSKTSDTTSKAVTAAGKPA